MSAKRWESVWLYVKGIEDGMNSPLRLTVSTLQSKDHQQMGHTEEELIQMNHFYRRRCARLQFIGVFISLWSIFFLHAVEAVAESYVAGQFGVSVPGTASDPDNVVSDRDLQSSWVYGAKLGHYLDKLRYFGVETEAYSLTPHIEQQAVTVNGIPAGILSGSHMRVTTWAANVVYRYPGETFQPYAGAGIGVFFAQGSNAIESDTSISPGLNVQTGVRVMVTQHLALFGEYKFNWTRLNFRDADERAQYKASLFMFGVGYHF